MTDAPPFRGRPHCLYVAWGFPPAKSGGVFRMLATANLLVRSGWRVTVLACDMEDLRRYAGCDEGLLDLVDPQVEVVRVPFDLGVVESDLRRYSWLRANVPSMWQRLHRTRARREFPENVYGFWRRPLCEAARQVHARDPVDVVLASGGPFVSFTAGAELSRRHGVPYVLDYRDSWSLQQFTDQRLHAADSPVGRAEAQLLEGASEAWFVNEAMREWHEAAYPQVAGRTRVVLNGYDPEPLEGLPAPSGAPDQVRFGFLGTLTTAVPLQECLSGYRLARSRDAAVASSTFAFHGYLGFYPAPNASLKRWIDAAADIGVTYEGPVPKSRVGDVYAQLDALVLTFGGSRYVTSGKVFEYMATGRPIVSVHGVENAVRDVLDGYPLWFQASSLEPEDVAEAFEEAAAAVVSGHAGDPAVHGRCIEHASRFERATSLREGVKALARIGGAHG